MISSDRRIFSAVLVVETVLGLGLKKGGVIVVMEGLAEAEECTKF
jgi:hypothetical protein